MLRKLFEKGFGALKHPLLHERMDDLKPGSYSHSILTLPSLHTVDFFLRTCYIDPFQHNHYRNANRPK